jgi:hypothetical protein
VLQSAIARLKRDGFVHSVNRQGLFVADAPPHLHRYGLVFGGHPSGSAWSRHDTAMVNEAHRIERQRGGPQFIVYHDVLDAGPGLEELNRLRRDVEAVRLAGLMLTAGTHGLSGHAPFSHRDVLKAFVDAAFDSPLSPKVGANREQMYLRALQFLASKGRRRVAIIHMAGTTYGLNHAALFAEAGVPLHAPWIQYVGRSHPEHARTLVPLLMDYPPAGRPDGLIVADDNLAEHAAAGLVDAGLRAGQDLEVVAHCNWPWPFPNALPCVRIGFDAGDMLLRAVDCIAQQRAGRKPPDMQMVPALFENEWPLPDAAAAVAAAAPRPPARRRPTQPVPAR